VGVVWNMPSQSFLELEALLIEKYTEQEKGKTGRTSTKTKKNNEINELRFCSNTNENANVPLVIH